jgi:addiction module HigA family antidote
MTKRLRNIHPGEVLLEEFLQPFEVTPYRLAKDIGVPPTRVSEICHGRRAITADTALRLARYFGTSPKFWLGLQEDYDLEELLKEKAKELDAIEPLQDAG